MQSHVIGAKTDEQLQNAFERAREKLGLTKSEAVREALRLFIKNGPPE